MLFTSCIPNIFNDFTEILKAAKDKAHLFRLVDPDFTNICWSDPPEIIEEAHKVWGIG